ncbi:hypothetical protein Q7P35_001722 [Cladosporium inversicolor]
MENTNTALVAKSDSTTAERLLRSENYSDLTIVCQGRQFKFHKAILCPQSDVISRLCDIDMAEKRSGVIEHVEFDAETVERMIDFAYKKEYDVTRRPKYELGEEVEDSITVIHSLAIEDAPTAGGITLPQGEADADATVPKEEPAEFSTTEKWVIHARVYGLADYYDMPELREHACSCFMEVADHELEDSDLEGFDEVAREVCKTNMREDGSARYTNDSPLHSGFLTLLARYAPELAPEPNFSAVLCEPDLQDSAAGIFGVLAQRIADLEAERDVNTSTFEAEKATFQRSVATAKADAESRIFVANSGRQMAEGKLEHTESVMERLVKSLRTLSGDCANSNCSNHFGSLALEQKGNGEWQVRCGVRRCRARLNRS